MLKFLSMGDWAVIKTGGKQYKVNAGETIVIEKLPDQKNEILTFDQVLAAKNGDKTQIGTPYIEKARITAKILENFRGKKVHVVKFKPKARYRKARGHRQSQLKVQIEALQIPLK